MAVNTEGIEGKCHRRVGSGGTLTRLNSEGSTLPVVTRPNPGVSKPTLSR